MVEWKKLGEVCKVHTGSQLNKADMLENGPYPVVNGGKEYSGYTDKYNENAYTITISQGGESAGYVNWLEVCFWAGAHCYVVENPEGYNTRYLYHTLKNKEREIQLSKQGAGIPGLNRDTLYKQVIPIPSLEEQTRIVGILDTFTSAIDNLKEQIAQRRKQYEYYRDQLLDLEGKEGVEMKTLTRLCTLITKQTGFDYSKTIKPSLTIKREDDSIPFIQNKDFEGTKINLNTDFYIPYSIAQRFPKILLNDKILLVSISGRIGNVGLYDIDEVAFVGGAICVCRLTKDINSRYVLYYLQSKYGQNALFRSVKAASHANITVESIRETVIPIPSLFEQQHIVSVLDTFEASIQNLETLLSQREKQYEYYRNKLLTFE